MNLPEISIKRPVTVLMMTLIVILFGIVSMTKLPVELYPNTSFGEISIIINARGGIPPSEVEDLITRLVEDAVSTVSDLEQVLSISKEGECTVVLSFKSGTDMDFAALEVREKFAKIKNQLPKEIEKPVIAQFQQGDVPIIIVSATSERRTTEEIRKIVDNTMKESLKRVAGVANVEIAGGRERKIMVEADQTRLAAFGIPIDEVTGALGSNNLNLLSGEVERTRDKYLVRVIGEFDSISQIENMGLRRTDQGSVIRVKDVAIVKDSFLEAQEYARLNVKPVVTAYVQKESSKNTITVAKDILKEIDLLKHKLPQDIHLVVTSNQAEFIEKAIDNLKDSLFQGILLIVLVFFIFLFKLNLPKLGVVLALIGAAMFFKGTPLYVLALAVVAAIVIVPKFRSIVIVTLPVPISAIGTFIFMRSMGLTINVMTLFGIALGVGMLVDNSIVVFENILKKREQGLDIKQSAVQGADEMFLSIVASTLTNVIVFLPLVFMGEELQKLYSGMAMTIVISLFISLVCAVSLVPMMCSQTILSGQISNQAEAAQWVDRFARSQRKLLFTTIRNQIWVVAGAIAVLLISWFMMSRLGLEYLGSTEQNKFTTYVEMPTGTKLEVSDKTVKKVEQIMRKIPEVKNVSSRIEAWSSKVYVELVPATQRKRTVNDIIESVRPETSKMHPAFVYFQQEEQVGTKEVILELFGYNYDKLRELAIAMANKLGQVKGLTDAKIRMREGRPEMQVLVQKKTAGIHGIDVGTVANQVHGQMRGFRATVFHTEGKEVETITRLDEKYRKTFKDLHRLILTTENGDPILLEQLSDFKFGLGPSEIWRKNRNRMIQVSANIGKVPLSKIVEDIKFAMKDIPFPEDYFYRVGGDYPNLVKTNKQMRMMIVFVLVLIYLVLAALFESFAQPILIMVAVPLALVGAVIALTMGPKTISIGALLGMMMLGGIVVNNSIMLMDRINYYVRDLRIGHVRSAVMATQDRLRPILMTFASTVLGLVPMAIDKSEGANLWSPLAITVIGGIVSSTALTLLVTPSFYIIYTSSLDWISKTSKYIMAKRVQFAS
ncbi:MAG: Cobalt-zinc-cadmium resistance protein CzcA [Candidatus Omnitrophica bacterium]|nr:Cobalt-zinc-cadmium resistance protein CzcA [Candidatus Omnitrophota bacterium]